MAKIRIVYFEAEHGDKDVSVDYEVDLKEGEVIVSVERCLDGGYNTDWCRTYIQVPE